MLKKKIAYEGFDGKPYEEEFCFHITEADIAKMELGATKEGGFEALINKIVKTTDGKKLVALFDELILLSVGELSPDGKHFVKNDEITDNFKNSNAYTKLFLELVTETEKGVEFVNGIVPQALRDGRALAEVTDKVANRTESVPSTPANIPSHAENVRPVPEKQEEKKDDKPAWFTEGRVPTEEELRGAPQELIMEAFRRRSAQRPDPESISG